MKAYDNSEECTVIADEILAETSKAILCQFGADEIWLPLSQVECSGVVGDTDMSVIMPFWLVEKNELEDFISD